MISKFAVHCDVSEMNYFDSIGFTFVFFIVADQNRYLVNR